MPADLPGIVRLRDRREALTLRTILTAARGLFAELGYARTPIRRIARDAGVAPQTVYAHFGSKAGVLGGLVDLLDDESGIPDLLAESATTADPVELLGLLARINRQMMQRCGDIVTILRSGAAVDPDIAATMAEGLRRNRIGVETIIERVRATGTRVHSRAADIAVALMSTEIYDRLVTDAGWSHEDYEAWLGKTLATGLIQQQ
jgi:AcrR family transcriptional regulator